MFNYRAITLLVALSVGASHAAAADVLATTADVNTGMMPELSSLAMIALGALYMLRRVRKQKTS